jgi:exodeoxyribonuclease VII small subunit
MTEPVALTFEEGYTRLQTISKRVTSEEVPVAEMCELFAEGKGLQKSLTEYLGEQKSRVEAIDRGEGIQAFRIVSPSPSDKPAPAPADDVPVNTADFSAPASAPRPPVPADDDIPF